MGALAVAGSAIDGIRATGNIENMDGFEGAMKAFADSFQPSHAAEADEPTPSEVLAADATLAEGGLADTPEETT